MRVAEPGVALRAFLSPPRSIHTTAILTYSHQSVYKHADMGRPTSSKSGGNLQREAKDSCLQGQILAQYSPLPFQSRSFLVSTPATMEGSAPSTELIEQQVEYLEGLVTSSYGAWLAFRQLNPDSHDYHRISQSITRLDPSTGESITMLLQAVEGFLTAPLTDPTRYHRSGSVMTFQKFLLTETGPGGFLEAFIHQTAVQDEYVRTSIIDKVMMLPEGTVDTLLGWNRKQRWQYITHNPDSQYTRSLVELSQIETWIIMGDDYDTVAVKMGGSPGTVQGRLNRQWKRIHPSILEGGHQSFARRGSRQAAQLYPVRLHTVWLSRRRCDRSAHVSVHTSTYRIGGRRYGASFLPVPASDVTAADIIRDHGADL